MARVRPLIDYRAALVSGHGVGRYVRELVRALCLRDDVEPGLFAPTWKPASFDVAGLGVERARLFRRRVPSKLLTRALRATGLGVERCVGGADLVHHTQYRRLPTRRPEVATIHDLVFLDSDRFVGAETAARMAAFAREAARACRVLITPSETVADEVAERLDVPRARVVATPLGVDHVHRMCAQDSDVATVAQECAQRGPFLFTAARLETRKNLVAVLRAFEALDVPGLRWKVAGSAGEGAEVFFDAVRRSPARDRIELLGHVSESVLRALLEASVAFVLVPHDEGFGLAPLEAMALGVPAISSDVPVVREVCGGGAALVEPTDVEGLAAALTEVATDPEARRAAIARGRSHASRFLWSRTAEATVHAYELAVDGTSPVACP